MNIKKTKTKTKLVFVLYLLVIFCITLLPLKLKMNLNNISYHGIYANGNFNPLFTITKIIEKLQYTTDVSIFEPVVTNFVPNVLLYVPLAFVLMFSFKTKYTLSRIVVIAFSMSLITQLLQLFTVMVGMTYGRVFDIEDIIANIIGSVLGYALLYGLNVHKKWLSTVFK